MVNVIIGNLCSLLAMLTDTISASRKTTSGVLLFQTLSQLLYAVSSFVLKGYSATVQNIVCVFRNLLAISPKKIKWLEWFLVFLGVALGIVFNNLGAVGWLPILATLEYSIAVFTCENNEVLLKLAFALCIGLFTIFNIAILNFVGAASNLFVFVMTIYFLIKQRKEKKHEEE